MSRIPGNQRQLIQSSLVPRSTQDRGVRPNRYGLCEDLCGLQLRREL
jgi:hypothetical protein